MITIAKRQKDKVDILNDLRKKYPYASEAERNQWADEKIEKKLAKIRSEHPCATIIDLTSKSKAYIGPTKADDDKENGLPAVYFSPFYPHRNIPVPGYDNIKATCVEAVWQGLKVFQGAGVDFDTFRNATGRNIKRTVRRFGTPLGHAHEGQYLDYLSARELIYLPTYKYMLDNIQDVQTMIGWLRNRIAKGEEFVFLDYNTNGDWRDLSSPLSHASLVKAYIENDYPDGSKPSDNSAKGSPKQDSLFPDL